MCAEKLPTLAATLPNFEMFMTSWEVLATKTLNLKPYTDVGLKWATKYYRRMDQSKAYIIAMGTFFLIPASLVTHHLFSLKSLCSDALDRASLGCNIY